MAPYNVTGYFVLVIKAGFVAPPPNKQARDNAVTP